MIGVCLCYMPFLDIEMAKFGKSYLQDRYMLNWKLVAMAGDGLTTSEAWMSFFLVLHWLIGVSLLPRLSWSQTTYVATPLDFALDSLFLLDLVCYLASGGGCGYVPWWPFGLCDICSSHLSVLGVDWFLALPLNPFAETGMKYNSLALQAGIFLSRLNIWPNNSYLAFLMILHIGFFPGFSYSCFSIFL